LIGGIAVGPISRVLCAIFLGADHLAVQVLTPCCLDSLLAGALLAWCAQRSGGIHKVSSRGLQILAWGGGIATAVLAGLRFFHAAPFLVNIASPLAESALFTALIAACARGVEGPAGRFLNNRFLQYTGRISYGLYLYHMFARYIGGMIAQKLGLTFPAEPSFLQFTILFGMSYGAAVISAHLIERPINDLKRFFPTGPSKKTGTAPEPATRDLTPSEVRG
jgi:peptidoglycan/LPS O-acetylase OafA/YrhL